MSSAVANGGGGAAPSVHGGGSALVEGVAGNWPNGSPAQADWAQWVDRLAALERSCMLQAEHTGHATREASRVAGELQARFTTAQETAAAVVQLTRLVQASNATVERVAAEVAAMRGTAC